MKQLVSGDTALEIEPLLGIKLVLYEDNILKYIYIYENESLFIVQTILESFFQINFTLKLLTMFLSLLIFFL